MPCLWILIWEILHYFVSFTVPSDCSFFFLSLLFIFSCPQQKDLSKLIGPPILALSYIWHLGILYCLMTQEKPLLTFTPSLEVVITKRNGNNCRLLLRGFSSKSPLPQYIGLHVPVLQEAAPEGGNWTLRQLC